MITGSLHAQDSTTAYSPFVRLDAKLIRVCIGHRPMSGNASKKGMDKMRIHVEKAFQAFVLKFGGELVSGLISNVNPPKNADYLFRSPLVIAELKVVARDAFTSHDADKLNELVHKWIRTRAIGPIFGTREIYLRGLPPQCQQEWLGLHMMPFKRKLADADKQIKNTKALLDMPNACGILFLVDDAAHSFPPLDAMNFITRVLQSKKDNGSPVYSHLDRIVYFSVNPKVVSGGIGQNFWLPGYRQENEKVIAEFLEQLRRSWIQFHGDITGTHGFELPAGEYPVDTVWQHGLNSLRVRD
jgi:hypothetical protein